jgi:hypothetical protein
MAYTPRVLCVLCVGGLLCVIRALAEGTPHPASHEHDQVTYGHGHGHGHGIFILATHPEGT